MSHFFVGNLLEIRVDEKNKLKIILDNTYISQAIFKKSRSKKNIKHFDYYKKDAYMVVVQERSTREYFVEVILVQAVTNTCTNTSEYSRVLANYTKLD